MVQRNDLSGRISGFSKSGISINNSHPSAKTLAHRRRMALLSIAAASVAFTAGAKKSSATPVTGFGNENYNFGATTVVSGLTAGTGATTAQIAANTTAIQNAINAGGVVEITSGTFKVNTLTLHSNVDLQLDLGATLFSNVPDSVNNDNIITTSGTQLSPIVNVGITGSGTIDGSARNSGGISGNKLVNLQFITNLLIKGVTIQDSHYEHLIPEFDTNVTIDGININDNAVLSANKGAYLGNTDGIDYSGTNIIIENSSVQDGDDNVVDKSSTQGTHGVLIQNMYIGAGHGIGVGGGFQGGIDNYTVNNITFNGTSTGLRIKANDIVSGDTGGGAAHPASATYENIVMTNVPMPIEFDSFYSGGENLPASPVPGVSSGSTRSSNPTNNDQYPTGGVAINSTTPVFQNVLFKNITSVDTASGSVAGDIFGENVSGGQFAVYNVTFSNVNLTARRQLDIWYAGGLQFYGLVVNDTTSNTSVNSLNTGPTNIANVYYYGDEIDASEIAVPEPTALALALPALAGLASTRLLGRKRKLQT
jgi:hypothetical protein